MHIEWVPNRKSRPTILLRETWREGKHVKKRTLANLTDWPEEKIEAFRKVLRGETAFTETAVTVERSLPHGQVEAILGTMKKLKFDSLIASKPCRERNLVLAMIAARLMHPSSKLATTRLWHTSTLAEELSVGDADEDELYRALDWLFARQGKIEKKLAHRHLREDSLVLYDVTSSYYEGHACPLAQFGHDRDEKDKPIIVYGALTDHEGRPVALSVYPGNTGDPTTIPDQVAKLKTRFGLEHIVLVGDRGMLTQTQIEKVKRVPGVGWISALRSSAIRDLVEQGNIQMSLFDTQDLAEISSDEYPDERLIACFNPLLAQERRRKRVDLLNATEKILNALATTVARRTRTPLGKADIGKKVGAVMNRFKVDKHFVFTIDDGHFSFTRNEVSIAHEEALDGIYVIRTSESSLSAEDTVRSYKYLAQVERVFKTFKGIEMLVRPIWHRTEDHVRAHLFLCMLAYYVEWHMRQALKPLLFDDETLTETRKTRHPVKPAEPSPATKKKKAEKRTTDGFVVHNFSTLMAALGTRCRSRLRIGASGASILRTTELTPLQAKAFQLLGL